MATLTVTSGLSPSFASGDTVTPDKLNLLGTPTVALTAGTIVDADVSAGASIALSKLATGALPAAITTTTANIVDASVTPAKLSQPYTLATAQASTSGTSIDFTGIPSWAKRVTVMFSGVSLSGTQQFLIQLGSGSVQVTGYNASSTSVSNTAANNTAFSNSTAGFPIMAGTAAGVYGGSIVFTLVSANAWVANGQIGTATTGSGVNTCTGNVTLSGAIDRVRITTISGTDTFDAGSINIAYEG